MSRTEQVPEALGERCAHAFTSRAKALGREAFRAERVRLVREQDGAVFGQVDDGEPRPFLVALDFREARTREILAAACTCPHGFEGHFCRHIYACLLAIDAAALDLPALPQGGGRLDLVVLRQDGPLAAPAAGSGATPAWRRGLAAIREAGPLAEWPAPAPRGPLCYLLRVERSREEQGLVIEPMETGPEGLRPFEIAPHEVEELPPSEDRELLALLAAVPLELYRQASFGFYGESRRYTRRLRTRGAFVPPGLYASVLPPLVASGRLLVDPGSRRVHRVLLDPPLSFSLELRPAPAVPDTVELGLLLHEGERPLPVGDLALALPDGLIVHDGVIRRLAPAPHLAWLGFLRRSGPLLLPRAALDEALAELLSLPRLPPLSFGPGLDYQLERPRPRPELRLEAAGDGKQLLARLSFDYGGHRVPAEAELSGWLDPFSRKLSLRDRGFERQMLELLRLHAEPAADAQPGLAVRSGAVLDLARALGAHGFRVEVGERRLRGARAPRLAVSSGVDWFELEARFDFGGTAVSLPELLRARRQGKETVLLADGSEAVLPQHWLDRWARLAEMGEAHGARLRFRSSQALLLDLLLESTEGDQVSLDDGFRRTRERLLSFAGVRPRQESPRFGGVLREYQRVGLGWLWFLEEVGLGGCLADDMGLGKTVQVLALLEGRLPDPPAREGAPGAAGLPSLIVAPRSLVHNWLAECRRFAPRLRAREYSAGSSREEARSARDLLITTYGTVRRDAAELARFPFDYVVLDEAQAVKNPSAQTSKAVRLLSARHRLALSGTPVENQLGDLWSIFEFLNPRMLRSKREMTRLASADSGGSLADLARVLRPLILRRTKRQVLAELPEKTELTIECELEGEELRLYQELRDHYRTALGQHIAERGFAQAKIHVLEALLRLRQAACHPGLVDRQRTQLGSAKLETLLGRLSELVAEGHKALVFSQFVSFLEIIRARLNKEGVRHAYLDGKTKDRAQVVDMFQNDPGCAVFLISLKAGGQGLNLTAADYVFILDPWWNPAAEVQAIDRAHRIGQSRAVFAYRLISRGTVEEKVLLLQHGKRQLAEAILNEDDSFLAELTPRDLEVLLE